MLFNIYNETRQLIRHRGQICVGDTISDNPGLFVTAMRVAYVNNKKGIGQAVSTMGGPSIPLTFVKERGWFFVIC